MPGLACSQSIPILSWMSDLSTFTGEPVWLVRKAEIIMSTSDSRFIFCAVLELHWFFLNLKLFYGTVTFAILA